MPLVKCLSRPKGLPSAKTVFPTCRSLESPTVSGWSTESGASTLITARSVDASVPTTFAS